MRITRKEGRLRIAANLFEGRLLREAFRALITNYKIAPDQLNAKAFEAWYSTRGCVTAKMSAEETREWLKHLHGFRSARLGLLERLAGQLDGAMEGALGTAGPTRERECHFWLQLEEARELLTALNDHRLLLAAQHNVGQAEMDLRSMEEFARLKPARRTALFEIHLLAELIEELLRCIAPEAANWMEQ